MNKQDHKYIKEFKNKVLRELKNEILLAQIFGSASRGDFSKDSDIDILLVGKDKKKVSKLVGDFVIETLIKGGPYFSVKIFDPEKYKRLNNPPTFFMQHLKRDARNL